MLSNFPTGIKSEDMLKATGPGLDVFSYHFYGPCRSDARRVASMRQTSAEAALSEDWLSRTERDARFLRALGPVRAGQAALGNGNGGHRVRRQPVGVDFIDTFRSSSSSGRLATTGVQVIVHNTLAASDYA